MDSGRRPLRMLLPPPNVTGELHIGHALMISIEDALARYYRMNQNPVVWAPGTDHAGIATQMVVERMLAAERGVTRQELGREKFVQEVEAWREKYGSRILEQMRMLGASTTNSREYYTKDERLSKAVAAAFVRLWEEGLIYRDTRMVNWSTELQTAVSDIEVVTEEISGKNPKKVGGAWFGQLHTFAFKLAESEGEIVVSTTRPETIPGDRAVAVHPDDPRYKHLHYKEALHPLIPGLKVPIVPDATLVDPSFGSGAVKITPAHDINDYAFWKRHSSLCTTPPSDASEEKLPIPLVQVFDSAGKMLPACNVPNLIGHDRLHIRKRVVALLEEAGVYRGKEAHDIRLPVCERSGAVIEPMLQPQWYLRMKPLAQKVKEVAKRDGLRFAPESPYAQLWDQWLDGVEDWCLSRQIWWGHRIPAYGVVDSKGEIVRWIAAETEQKAASKLTADEAIKGCMLKQDEDVLDTWFSSGLLPLTTAGWTGKPNQQPNRENYPLSFIESGGDILFFWLARMAMLCTHFTDKLPFPEIILHPLVCDAEGKKMSKSVGNVLDPLLIVQGRSQQEMISDVIKRFEAQEAQGGELQKDALKKIKNQTAYITKAFPQGIARSGADALRMALVDYTRQTRQIKMELRHVDNFRKMAIKLDNAVKFFHQTQEQHGFTFFDIHKIPLQPADKFLLFRLRTMLTTINEGVKQRRLHEATEAIRAFLYNDLCATYLEFIKFDTTEKAKQSRRNRVLSILQVTLDVFLRAAHPFMPFLTEELWQELLPAARAEHEEVTIMTAKWPQEWELPQVTEQQAQLLVGTQKVISALRAVSYEKKENVQDVLVSPPDDIARYVWENLGTVLRLGKRGAKWLNPRFRTADMQVLGKEEEGWVVVSRSQRAEPVQPRKS
ncbi:tRNA synthetases class I-domain-containing protein [Sphaerosporella brunnea]|uniref:valine--tRNA ligase n=1 Tax=Sphaerosporella brunnea TaxID=1250544 RepID=A0A5J5EFY1_9PEZI|nr:tRNA synthetases class I-domain-containing protein [Sphaerosporella brunnea]